MSGNTPTPERVKLVAAVLQRHRPVDVCETSVEFECGGFRTCICGEWVSFGWLFDYHRASEIVAALDSSEIVEAAS